MKRDADSPLDGVAAGLAVLAIVLRWNISGETAGPGLNLLINLFFWLATGCWFLGRASRGGLTWRFTGFEFPLLALAIVGFLSALGASHALPALTTAFSWLTGALTLVLVVHVLPRSATFRILTAVLAAFALYALLQNLVILPGLVDEAGSVAIRRRAESGEVFATFLYPNSYAGFLVLLVPFLLGRTLDSRGGDRAVLGLHGATLMLCLVAAGLTGSLGGWLALGIGLACFAALAFTRTRGRKAVVFTGLGLALAALVFSGPLLDALASRAESMANRRTYWDAALKIVPEAPVLGVGPSNFEDYYYQFKSDAPQEVNKAHNDYLQVLVETGVAGLLAFLALLGWGLRRALPAESPDPPPEPVIPAWVVPTAGLLAFPVALGFEGVFNDLPFLWVVVGGAWAAAYFVAGRDPSDRPTTFTRLGLAAGLVGFMVHMTVDFDFYDPGVAMTLFLVLGLIALLQSPPVEVAFPRAVCWAGAGATLVVTLPLLGLVAPPAIEADARLEAADILLREQQSVEHVEEALEAAAEAQVKNPMLAEAFARYSEIKFLTWDYLRRNGTPGAELTRALQPHGDLAILMIQEAIAIRPRHAGYHHRLATYHRAFRQYRLGLPGGPSRMDEMQAAEDLRSAFEAQTRALELYPTSARMVYAMARLLEFRGETGAAQTHYEEALRLSDLAASAAYPDPRLQLDDVRAVRTLRWAGRTLDARNRMILRLRREAEGRTAEEVRSIIRRSIQDPSRLGGMADENDKLMRTMIEDAGRGILREMEGK